MKNKINQQQQQYCYNGKKHSSKTEAKAKAKAKTKTDSKFSDFISKGIFDQICNASTVIEMNKIEKKTKKEINYLR